LIASILTQQNWDTLFPYAHALYTRENFISSVTNYPSFCKPEPAAVGNDLWNFNELDLCKRELSAFLANVMAATNSNNPNKVDQ